VVVIIRVKRILVEKPSTDLRENHLRASGTAIVVGILLMVRDRKILDDTHGDVPIVDK
jgi:hypothetical protein